jgi:hypothetical protein
MSDTFSIACRDCKKHLWIAQGSNRDKSVGHLYTVKPRAAALYSFLREHQKHNLVFDENCESDIADYEEVESGEPT